MIAVEQGDAAAAGACQGVLPAMAERMSRQRASVGAHDALMGYSAEREDGDKPGQGAQSALQIAPAGPDLSRGWLVLGGNAADRIGDQAIDQNKTVVDALAIGARREPERNQGFVQKMAGPVASERPPGAVGSAKAGREANNRQSGGWRAERVDRRVAPVRFQATPF